MPYKLVAVVELTVSMLVVGSVAAAAAPSQARMAARTAHAAALAKTDSEEERTKYMVAAAR